MENIIITDCTQLFLGNRGIERLHGFEPLVNLEVLWVNGNKLRAVTHLDANVRLRELYVHVSSCSRCWSGVR